MEDTKKLFRNVTLVLAIVFGIPSLPYVFTKNFVDYKTFLVMGLLNGFLHIAIFLGFISILIAVFSGVVLLGSGLIKEIFKVDNEFIVFMVSLIVVPATAISLVGMNIFIPMSELYIPFYGFLICSVYYCSAWFKKRTIYLPPMNDPDDEPNSEMRNLL